jgi:hypothetical protein
MSLKWLDDILYPPEDGTPAPEAEDISLEDTIDNIGISSNTDKGTVHSKDGSVVAQIDAELASGATDFELNFRLRVPKETWERTTIVCDGNAVEVATELAPNGRYIVKRTLRGFKPTKVVEESEIKLREFSTIKEFMNWIENMDNDGVEALRQIYYDRWCFDTASQKDRMYYELLEEEKQIRI